MAARPPVRYTALVRRGLQGGVGVRLLRNACCSERNSSWSAKVSHPTRVIHCGSSYNFNGYPQWISLVAHPVSPAQFHQQNNTARCTHQC